WKRWHRRRIGDEPPFLSALHPRVGLSPPLVFPATLPCASRMVYLRRRGTSDHPLWRRTHRLCGRVGVWPVLCLAVRGAGLVPTGEAETPCGRSEGWTV